MSMKMHLLFILPDLAHFAHKLFLMCYSYNFHFVLQITFCLLFALVVAFVSDGLSTVPDKASVLSSNTSFKHEFHELVRENIIAFFSVLIVYNI